MQQLTEIHTNIKINQSYHFEGKLLAIKKIENVKKLLILG
jgi:hypothetical protein